MQATTSTTIAFKHLGYVVAFLMGLDIHSFVILAAFMAIDLVLGTMRAGVVHGWQEVKSYKFIAGITSKLLVLFVPVLLVWAGRGANVDLLFLGQGALAMLVLAETYSILGNINSIRLRRDIPEFDVISSILRTVQEIVGRLLSANREKL